MPRGDKTLKNPFNADPKKLKVDVNATTNRRHSSTLYTNAK
jgi:hypothetical protein